MTLLGALFLLINAITLLTVSRRWAPAPLLIGACYITLGQKILIGPFNFSVIRLLVLTGVIRILSRNERISGGWTGLDRIMLFWSVWQLASSVFHQDIAGTLVYHLGIIYNTLGSYFLLRVFCKTEEDVSHLVCITAYLLLPVALEMMQEKMTGKDLFSIFGGVEEYVVIRDGRFRAQGPFSHAILAGTVAAGCIPLMVGIWHRQRMAAIVGIVNCITMIVASASSGPLMSMMLGLGAMFLLKRQFLIARIKLIVAIIYLLITIVSSKPAYFILARIDLTGSSTGWHRAELIRTAIAHFDEWWLGGTDVTSHWMPYGLLHDNGQADITNQYLINGVQGGIILTICFILSIRLAFKYVGHTVRYYKRVGSGDPFFMWSLGASLFAHAASCISVAYFDQSITFLYTVLASICSLYATTKSYTQDTSDTEQDPGHLQTLAFT